MLGLGLYESEICDCGFHSSLAHDPTRWFTVERQTCPLCADLDAQARVQSEKDHKVAEKLKDQPGARRPADGRRAFVRPMTPAEVDEMRATATRDRQPRQ